MPIVWVIVATAAAIAGFFAVRYIISFVMSRSAYIKGNCFFDNEDIEGALQQYEKALKIRPGMKAAIIGAGLANNILGRYEEALLLFDKVWGANPKIFISVYYKGNTLLALERYSEAVECFDRALEIEPRSADSSAILTARVTPTFLASSNL